MIPSIEKTLHYLNSVSKDNHKITYCGLTYEMTAKKSFGIRPTTFYKDECLSCGQCCRNYDTVMFPSDMPEIKRRAEEGQEPYQFYLDNCNEYSVYIDGKECRFFSVPPMTAKDNHDIWTTNHKVLNCRWIFLRDGKKLCRIHEYRCITCGFPHMELYYNHEHDVGFLGHKQFGRNHQLGCTVDLKRPMDTETLEDNLYWLGRLQVVADYFDLRTYLPEIIEFLKRVDISDPPAETYFMKREQPKKLFNID